MRSALGALLLAACNLPPEAYQPPPDFAAMATKAAVEMVPDAGPAQCADWNGFLGRTTCVAKGVSLQCSWTRCWVTAVRP